jgi:hypothetical protein
MRTIWYSFIIIAFLSRSVLFFYYALKGGKRRDDFASGIWFLVLAMSYTFYTATRLFPEGLYAEFVFDGILGAMIIVSSTLAYWKTLKRERHR